MREEVIEILSSVKPGVDFENAGSLISGRILSSMNIVELVNNLSDEFDVEIGVNHIIPENFETVDAIVALIEKLSDED